MGDSKNGLPVMPERIAGLGELAYNLWWSWHPAARMVFKTLDRVAWKESGHNPVKMLKELPPGTLEAAAQEPDYCHHVDAVLARFRREIAAKKGCFYEDATEPEPLPIAYFSAEYGLHHSLPFYAGGLGFLAGDHLKECSDLGVPLVAVGFIYPEGYLRQKIRVDGWQDGVDERLDKNLAAITMVLNETGAPLVVKVPFIEPPLHVAVRQVMVGKIPLYLMDTDIEMNDPWNRGITSHLYAGDIEQRLRQEIVLGIGGKEVLNALGIKHSALHLNEGHPAFVVLERIRERVAEGMGFAEAAERVRATTVFTTHTPVPAGHDVFPFSLMDKYFGGYYPLLGIDRDAFLQLGITPGQPEAGFNMTAFALRMAAYRNGVSRKHGEVARKMWQVLWPEAKDEKDVPIDSITNGIHVPTWIEPKMELLFNKYLGPDWLADHDNEAAWGLVDDIPARELWELHHWLKVKLLNFIRAQMHRRWIENNVNPLNIIAGGALLDPMALTIGFARRFTGYKRAALIFHDLERLKNLLKNRWRPIQFIFAGKAHPSDDEGKRIIQQVFSLAIDPQMGGKIALVENYDEMLAQYLVHGVDVWLNNPLPPLEASGTSGMKASLNGVPHLSILDGWWVEGFNGKNGWAFTGKDDAADADALYGLLEKEIVPLYYKRDEKGVPRAWVEVMKAAIKSTAPAFSARRMAKEYIEKYYRQALKNA